MNKTTKFLIGASGLATLVCAGLLGWNYGKTIATFTVAAVSKIKFVLEMNGILGIAIYVGDFCYSLWQASKNKEKFLKAIEAT